MNQKNYEPDYIVETADTIYMIEIKAEKDIQDKDVQEKAKAAVNYCKNATDINRQYNDKPWKYVLIPHDKVVIQNGFESLAKQFEVKEIQ